MAAVSVDGVVHFFAMDGSFFGAKDADADLVATNVDDFDDGVDAILLQSGFILDGKGLLPGRRLLWLELKDGAALLAFVEIAEFHDSDEEVGDDDGFPELSRQNELEYTAPCLDSVILMRILAVYREFVALCLLFQRFYW